MKKDYSKIIIIILIIIILIISFLLLKDTLFPNSILRINGNEYVEHNLHDEYQDLGFSLDHGDSTKVQVNSNVDVTKEGIYDVIYTYKDQVITRHVEVKKINVLNLIGDKDVYTQVIVTNVITVRPKKFNRKKPYLPCGKYSKAQNDLLDTIFFFNLCGLWFWSWRLRLASLAVDDKFVWFISRYNI